MAITITDPGLLAELTAAPKPVELTAPDGRVIGVLTATRVEEVLAAAERLRNSPLFEEYEKAIEEYRWEHNTVPDPD
jgi:hypothetical protein